MTLSFSFQLVFLSFFRTLSVFISATHKINLKRQREQQPLRDTSCVIPSWAFLLSQYRIIKKHLITISDSSSAFLPIKQNRIRVNSRTETLAKWLSDQQQTMLQREAFERYWWGLSIDLSLFRVAKWKREKQRTEK